MTTAAEPAIGDLANELDQVSQVLRDKRFEVYDYIHQSGCPVRRTEANGGYTFIARYATNLALQRDAETFSNSDFTIPKRPQPTLIPATVDPPEHTAYKRVLSSFFTPRDAAKLAPRLREIAEARVTAGVQAGRFDLVQDVAFPLMAEFTMADVLGLDASQAFAYAQPLHNMTRRDYPAETVEEELAWLAGRLKADIEEGNVAPEGVLGRLLAVDFGGRALSHDELVLIGMNLLIGGMGTTSFFVGSVGVFLGRNPEHRRLLVQEPDLIPSAIDELLRVFAPVQGFGRLVTRDTEVEGCPLKAGEKVLLSYGAANFDPEAFANPQEVDFRRAPNRHMTFGIGPHRCLGSHIAKEVSGTITRLLLEQVPDYRLVEHEVVENTIEELILGYNRVPIEG